MSYPKEEIRAVIGARLRQERKRLRLTQQQLADVGGVRKQAQLKYETGDSSPNAEYLALIQQRGVDVQFVVTGIPTVTTTGDEADLLRRYRAAPPAVRTAVAAALGTVAVSAEAQSAFTIQDSEIGNVMEGGQTITAPLTFNVGGKKGGRKK